MMRYFHFRLFCLLFAGAICLPVSAQQQTNSNAPPPAPNTPSAQPDKNCSWGAAKGSGPWKSTSTCPPSSQGATDQATPPLATDKNSSAHQQKPSPDDANPFPEAQSQKAEDATKGSSAKANSAQPDYSSSHVDMTRMGAAEGSGSRISNGAGGFIHDPELAKQDEKVGKFYLQTGDYKGAYDRYKEATEVAPEDADAVFGLAESARGLHRMQEAATNYQLYLDAVPDGKRWKEARKALAELSPSPKK